MNNIDLNQPQRQAKKGLVVIFFSVFKLFLRSILPLVAILLFKKDGSDKSGQYLLIFAAIIFVVCLVSVLNFLYFKFYIHSKTNEFILEKGWLNKSKTVIKLDKIQQVNLNQKFFHRLLDLYSVEVDSAGSTKTEIKINAVSRELAQALRTKLLEKDNKEVVTSEAHIPNNCYSETNQKSNASKTIKISVSSLVKVGLTRHYLQTFSLIFIVGIQLLEKIQDYFRSDEINVYSQVGDYAEEHLSLLLIPFILIAIVFLVLIINLIRTLTKYFHYKIQIINKSLLIAYGLLETKNTIIKAQRVQIFKITQNFFQKKMNILIIKIMQVYGEGGDSKGSLGIDIPGVNANEKDLIIHEIFKKEIKLENKIKPSIRKFVVHFIWFSLFPSALYFLVSWKYFEPNYMYITIFLFLFTALYQWKTYRNSEFYFSDNFIVSKSGFWDISYHIIEPHKIQRIKTYQRIWHLNLNLGSVVLYTAGGEIHFSIADESEIRKRVNYWLYKVEKENLNWM